MLEWFAIPVQEPTMDAKLAARESTEFTCIVLESGSTCSFVSKPPQHLLFAVREFCFAREERYEHKLHGDGRLPGTIR